MKYGYRVGLVLMAMFALMGHCSAAVLWQEDFEGAPSALETKLNNIYHTGGSSINYDLGPGRNSAKSLRWLRHDAGWYYAWGYQNLSSTSGRFSVSFWLNSETASPYRWHFSLDNPAHSIGYLTLIIGYMGEGTNWDPGKIRSTNPDMTLRTICPLKTGWRQVKLIVDFDHKIFDLYYDDMSVPAATEISLQSTSVTPTTPFVLGFSGVSGSSTEGKFSVDDMRVDDLGSAEPSANPSGPVYSMLGSLVNASVSQTTGAIVGLSGGTRRLVDSTNDIYILRGPISSAFAREARDVVVSSTGDTGSRVLTCSNSALPGVAIVKTYSFAGRGQLVKHVAFSTSSTEGFLTHFARVKLDAAFQQDSYPGGYRFADDSGGYLTDMKAMTYVGSKDYSAGLGVYRCSVNGRWVLPGVSLPNVDGWDLTVFCDYLSGTKSVSGSLAFASIPGDFTTFANYTAATPEYANLFSDAKPAWTSALLCDTMYAGPESANAFHMAAEPLTCTSTIWFLNPPWGNWWGDSDPPFSWQPAPDVYHMADSLRGLAPDLKLAAYTNPTFDKNSDVYKLHYDFGIKDKDGTIVDCGFQSDSGGASAYWFQVLNPTARQYMLDMHADRTQKWSLDFFYSDGFANHEIPDWTLKAVAQSYDWLDFYRELKTRIKSVKSEAAIFTNGNAPYSDIGYIEWRDWQWKELAGISGSPTVWRRDAMQLLNCKLAEFPGYTWVPTYGEPNAQPAINTYAINYGWCGHLPYIEYMPWMRAALEYRGMRLSSSAVQQPWWRESNPTYEAYGFTKGENAVVNVIGHSDATTATVTLNRADLGLELGRKYLCRVMTMNNSANTPVPTTAFTKGTPSMLIVNSDTITLTVPVSKGLLTSVVFSKVWVMVEHTGAQPCETRIPENYGVTAKLTSISGDFYRYNVVTKYAGAVVFFPFAITLNNPPGGSVTQTIVDGVIGMRATFAAAGSYNFNAKTPNSISSAKKQPTNTRVLIDNVVVTDNSVESGTVFVETEDRASGIKLVTSQSLPVGQRIQFYGSFSRVDGEYQIGNATIFQSIAGALLSPVFMTAQAIGNDMTETLNYSGLDVTQLLVRFAGVVTGVITAERVIYVDDGKNLRDGVGGFSGMRVHVPIGATMPGQGSFVSVTGITRPEKHVLGISSMVNGLSYSAGTVVYVPSVSARASSDIQVIPLAL